MSSIIHIANFVVLAFLLLAITGKNNHKVGCFPLNYPIFSDSDRHDFFISSKAGLFLGALQVTADVRGASITNLAGRIVYKKRFTLWKNKNSTVASFNSTFVLNIQPQDNGGGEGLAFILAKDSGALPDSEGQWLGIVNPSTNGTSQNPIVAVEFDTRKSFPEDLDDNHVGLDINSVVSEQQASLNSSNITIAGGKLANVTAMVLYDGHAKVLNVSVFKGNGVGSNNTTRPVLSVPIDLAQHLPRRVYVGFSASTGSASELNCVREWYFNGDLIELGMPLRVRVLIPVSIVVLLLLLSLLFGGCLYWRKKRRSATRTHVSEVHDRTIQGMETGLGPKKINLKDLKAATGNFDDKNELGRGGFGVVYYGKWEGQEVAVKRIINTPQGKQNLVAEVTTIGRLHQKNLVKLIGWCYEGDELLLVYEFMPNGSLDRLVYTLDDDKVPVILTWEKRRNILCGVAQALDYLHNECVKRVLHRDVKASNIMLDAEFNARLGDFGLARMFTLSERTHHSTNEIAGTPGYMAPEILLTGRTTAETDVFAFGVLTLVVVCGRKPRIQYNEESQNNNNKNNIVDWVWELYRLEMVNDAVDPKLKGKLDKAQAECMLVLGLACCHPNPYMRPSMRSALQVLMGEALPPSVPFEKPVFMWPATPPSFNREESYSGGMLTSSISSLSGR